jgi:hypothetical protein
LEDPTSKNEDRIKELAEPFLEPGERVAAAITAAPRGKTTAIAAGGVGGLVGARQMGKNRSAAEAAGIVISSNMAVVVTNARLMTLEIKISAMGAVTEVKELLSAVPLDEIETVEGKRFGLGGVLILKTRGGDPIKLECKAGAAKSVADAYAGAAA